MASIIKEVSVDADADDVWAALRDFGSVHRRLASGFVQDCKLESDTVRVVTFTSGAQARELLVGIDDEARRLAYTVIDSPLGFEQHSASAQVLALDDDRSHFVWITDLLPDGIAATVDELMTQGIAAIKTTLENA
jgi:hypothetical protein